MATAPVALIATELMTHDLHHARQEACLRPLSIRIKILRDVANAICYLHRAKVYHGRIMPQNVMVRIHGDCLYGNAKLDVTTLLSRAVLSTQQKTRCTKNLLYFSPEQLSNGHQYYTGDIWSFGMVACYLLIDGPHLLHNPSEEAILQLIVNKKLSDSVKKWCACISDAGLRELVSRCLSEDPVCRIDSQTLSDLIQAAVDRLPEEPEKGRLSQIPYEDVDDVVLDSSGDTANPIVVDPDEDSDEVTFIGKKRGREPSSSSPPRRRRPRLIRVDDDESDEEEDKQKMPTPPPLQPEPIFLKEVRGLEEVSNLYEKGSSEFNEALNIIDDSNGDVAKAFRLFKKAAEWECVDAYRYCGQYLLNGWGTEQNHEEAVKYLRKAAAWNDSEAIRLLGVCHEEGHGVPVNGAEALRLYKKAAQLGEPTANTNVAICYDKGVGVRRNKRTAISYYKKAAAEDDEVALNNLGVLYNQGSKRDFALAVRYFREAIKYGSLEAQCNLGDCYMYGQGVPKDFSTALELYNESSEKGNLVARTEMATLYYLGLGVPVDYVKALSMYREASSVPEALRWLGIAHYDGNGVDENIEEAVRLFRQAIDMGSPEANLDLGMCYFLGKGVPQSYEQALQHYKVAAENDSKEASLSIGNMYFEGLGVQKDLNIAYKWYKEGEDIDLTYIHVDDKPNV
ncbi:Protein kinase [Gracilaria domingensis]|nr:Protein kinase [Gracilaria domingensis]